MSHAAPPLLRLAYNTNGLAHHRVLDALSLLADLGYDGVALTPDVGALDPFHLHDGEVEAVRARAEELGLALALESGARFLLDPRRKHAPSLLDEDPHARARRVDLYRRVVGLAERLGAPLLSLWSGAAPGGERAEEPGDRARTDALWSRLVDGLLPVLEHAGEHGVEVAFEPEPGMFVERPSGYRELTRRLGSAGPRLGLTLDVGHLVVTGDTPVPAAIRALAGELRHVHLDDARRGVHEHLMFGRGELDLAGTLAALADVGFGGLAAVELSRDSHRGADAAREALERLRSALPGPGRRTDDARLGREGA